MDMDAPCYCLFLKCDGWKSFSFLFWDLKLSSVIGGSVGLVKSAPFFVPQKRLHFFQIKTIPRGWDPILAFRGQHWFIFTAIWFHQTQRFKTVRMMVFLSTVNIDEAQNNISGRQKRRFCDREFTPILYNYQLSETVSPAAALPAYFFYDGCLSVKWRKIS